MYGFNPNTHSVHRTHVMNSFNRSSFFDAGVGVSGFVSDDLFNHIISVPDQISDFIESSLNPKYNPDVYGYMNQKHTFNIPKREYGRSGSLKRHEFCGNKNVFWAITI